MNRLYDGNKKLTTFSLSETDLTVLDYLSRDLGVSKSSLITLVLRVAVDHQDLLNEKLESAKRNKRAYSHNLHCVYIFDDLQRYIRQRKALEKEYSDFDKTMKLFRYFSESENPHAILEASAEDQQRILAKIDERDKDVNALLSGEKIHR